jgi:pimeloyl-ACP methyl ester carboxylesterase
MMITPNVRHGFSTGADDNLLHYLDYGGEGLPLVLLHGVTGHAWLWWEVAARLTTSRRVLALDLRGCGESQWSSSGAYATNDHVADLEVFVGALGVDEVDLMGSSWGGLVAVQYAAEHPGGVGRLVVVDVEPSFEQSETEVAPRSASFAAHDEIVSAEAGRNPNASIEMIELIAATGYRPAADGRLVPKHDPFFLERWPFRSDDHWDRLAKITAPTLLAHAEDSFVRGEVMAEMTARIDGARLVEVPNSGHVIPVDNPSELVAAIEPFLR